MKDNGKGSKKGYIWVIVNAQASFFFGFTMLIHSNILYTAGVLGCGAAASVYGKVFVFKTYEADIVRLLALTGGAVIS